jgi:hypothetical protein
VARRSKRKRKRGRGAKATRDASSVLAPLHCPSCAHPVPIGDGDTARCSFCRERVQIPEAYRELRAAARLDDVARARAEAIAEELARPPSAFVRFWIRAANVAIVLAALLVATWLVVSLVLCIATFADAGLVGAVLMLALGVVLGLPLLWDETLHGLARPLGVDLADVLGGAGAFGLMGLGIFVVSVLPIVLGDYARAFESVRIALRSALAANPAVIDGESAACRSCGAALHVRAGEVHARCVFCRADNLVLLPDPARQAFEVDMKVTCADLDAALEQETSAARNGRRTIATRLVRWSALVPGCILLGRCVASINENDATFWVRATEAAPMIPGGADNPVLPRGEPIVFDVHDTFDGCDELECWVHYFVAVREGETPWLSAEGGELRLEEVTELDVGVWYDPVYVWRVADFSEGAPYDGWYRVKLVTAKARGPEPIVEWGTSR